MTRSPGYGEAVRSLARLLPPTPAVGAAVIAKWAGQAVIVIGVAVLAFAGADGTWAQWLIVAGAPLTAAAMAYLLWEGSGRDFERYGSLAAVMSVLVFAVLGLAAAEVMVAVAASESAPARLLVGGLLVAALVVADYVAHLLWVQLRGWNDLAIRPMAIAYKGHLKGDWLEDPETGRRLKAVDDAEEIPMTVLECVPGPTDLYTIYLRNSRGGMSSIYNIRKFVAFGEEPTGAMIAGLREQIREGVELDLSEMLELEAKIRRTNDAAASEPGTTAFAILSSLGLTR